MDIKSGLKMMQNATKTDESALEKRAFYIFLTLPWRNPPKKRTNRNVAKELGISVSTVKRWRVKNKWDEKAKDFDNQVLQGSQEALKDMLKEKLAFEKEELLTLLTNTIKRVIKEEGGRRYLDVKVETTSDIKNLIECWLKILSVDDIIVEEARGKEGIVFRFEVKGAKGKFEAKKVKEDEA